MTTLNDPVTAFLRPLQASAHAVRVENHMVNGFIDRIVTRLYRPTAETGVLPVVLYFHGGGFVGGSLDDADIAARYLAEHARAAVLSVGYSLAPARPFPAAPEDAYAAARWLSTNAASLNIDATRMATAGDDAGGNLATTLTLIARDRNGPALSAQVLIGPMLDPSMTKLGDADRLGSDIKPQTCANCYAQYLHSPFERLHPYASPLESRRLAGLPSALILTAESDVLHKEAEHYASALIAAGVATQITRFAVKHAQLPEHVPLLAEAADFLKRHLHPPRTPHTSERNTR